MTVFEYLTSVTIDEFAEWLDKHGMFDGSPWMDLFDNNYCLKCESEIVHIPNIDGERVEEVGWCELHGKCKYFQDMDEVPDNKAIIKMWLEKEI